MGQANVVNARNVQLNRRYVADPRAWGYELGTDYIWTPSTSTALITSGTAGQVLSEYGWVTTGLVLSTAGSGSFLTSATPGTPQSLAFANTIIFRSPYIFGDYSHALAASRIMGKLPTTLTLETFGAFTTASASETGSVFGLLQAAGTASTVTHQIAAIGSDGTNFRMRTGAGSSWTAAATGPLIDNLYHAWKIVLSGTTATMVVDNVVYDTITLPTAKFPAAVFAACITTNVFTLGPIHVHYD